MSAGDALKGPVAAGAAVAAAVPAVVVGIALTASAAAGPAAAAACPGGGRPAAGFANLAAAGQAGWTAAQRANAHTLVAVAHARGLPRRAAVLAVSTAIVESGLRNVAHGDRDSLGLFQQRPSQGWGHPAQILTPVYAAGQFYDHLVAIPGWEQLPPGVAQQTVQRSAYPGRYAPAETAAAALVAQSWPVRASDSAQGRAPLAELASGACGENTAGSALNAASATLPDGFDLPSDPAQKRVVAFALAQVGKPYVWGAEGPQAFDCSGLTLAAWAQAGVALPRTTYTQVHIGTAVSSLQALLPGDLLFIPGSMGTAARPGHVGLYAGHGLVVNAYDAGTGVIIQPLRAWQRDIVAIRRPRPAQAAR